jgi:hypothetical protein
LTNIGTQLYGLWVRAWSVQCPKNAALEKTCAWYDGLFQIGMVAKPTSVWIVARPIVRKGQPLEWAVTDVCGRAKTHQ